MTLFDLRSDTVTRPSPAMREAMAAAEVGDDVYREDPTMRRLEERTAALLGKEAALFVPSGTMANQIGLLCHTRRGDEIVAGRESHCAFNESGAAPAWAGAQFMLIGSEENLGLFTAADLEAAIKPRAYYFPRQSLVVVENTHNRGGGRVFPLAEVDAVAAVARRHGLGLHLDGARVWNAAVALGVPVADVCRPFDTVSVCFSKGLGAPVGSAIAGSRAAIDEAVRFRKMLGGGMRQAGVLAAGALYALDHNLARIAEDHRAARRLGDALRELDGVVVGAVETNIVNVTVPCAPDAVVERAKAASVLISASGARQIRLVTHLDVVGSGFDTCVERTVAAFRAAVAG
jgi:threonine aldolase